MARKIESFSISIFVLFVFALAMLQLFKTRSMQLQDEDKPLLPVKIGDWSLNTQISIPDEIYKILGTKAAVLGEYAGKENEKFQLYILKSSSRRSSFHQPEYCYLGTGQNELLKNGLIDISISEKKIIKVNYLWLKTDKGFQLVIYFYTANELISPSYYKQQLYFLFKRLKNEPVRGLLIRIAKFQKNDDLNKEFKIMQDIVKSIVMNSEIDVNKDF